MKIKILLTMAATVLINLTFAQSTSCLLDSSYHNLQGALTAPDLRKFIGYDNEGRIIRQETKKFLGQQWVPFELNEYTLNTAGLKIEIVNSRIDAVDSIFRFNTKETNVYNSEGARTETETYRWADNEWKEQNKTLIIPNINHKDSIAVQYGKNHTNNTWDFIDSTISIWFNEFLLSTKRYVYDSEQDYYFLNNQILWQYEMINNVFLNTRVRSSIIVNGNLTLVSEDVNTFNNLGSITSKRMYNPMISSTIPMGQINYDYDGQGREEVVTTLAFNQQLAGVFPTNRRVHSYNDEDKVAATQYFSFTPNGAPLGISAIDSLHYYDDGKTESIWSVGYANNLPNGVNKLRTYTYNNDGQLTQNKQVAYNGTTEGDLISQDDYFYCQQIILSVDEVEEMKFSIAPNPTFGHVILNADIPSKATVLDFNGRVMGIFVINQGSNQLDFSNLTAGMYIIQMGNGSTMKFIKQ